MTAQADAVRLDGCSVTLGRQQVLREAGLVVPVGSVVGIRGFNGSGKSTVLRVIAGLISPTSGSVEVFGRSPSLRTPRPTIGAAIDALALYSWMGARGYLRTQLDLAGVADGGECDAALARVGLADVGTKRIFRYSQGMRKRLAWASATLCDPPLVLLDEPTNAMDRNGESAVAAWVATHRAHGGTLVLATHRPFDEELCDHLVDLEDGQLVEVGS